jgi:GAF domain/AMIN domain
VKDKFNASRDLHQRRARFAPTVAPTWEILQTVFGFAFTVQQELHKLRLENEALTRSQPSPPAVLSGYPKALGRIVTSAQNLTEASGAAIALGNDQSMICVARSGAYAPPLGAPLDPRSGLSGECIRTRENVMCMNAAADPRVDYKACMALGIRSMVYLPLLREDRVVGMLAVFSSKPQHFSHRDLNCLRWTDQLISEALQHEGSAQVGAATLVRDVEFGDPEPAKSVAAAIAPVVSSATPPAQQQSAAAATPELPPQTISIAAIPALPEPPKAPPTFVGTVVDEALEDEFFSQPEPNPKLAPRFNQKGQEYDSPVPLLVAILLVVAFLGVVSFITYKRLSTAPTTSATKAATAALATPSLSEAPASTSAEQIAPETTVRTTPGFPSGVSFESFGKQSVLRITLPKSVTYEGFAIQGPNRVYFDVRGVSLANSKGTSIVVDDELISRVRISLFRPGTTRIVFDLKGDNPFGVDVAEHANQLAIAISSRHADDPGAISPKPSEAVKITSAGNQVLRTPALPPYAAK